MMAIRKSCRNHALWFRKKNPGNKLPFELPAAMNTPDSDNKSRGFVIVSR